MNSLDIFYIRENFKELHKKNENFDKELIHLTYDVIFKVEKKYLHNLTRINKIGPEYFYFDMGIPLTKNSSKSLPWLTPVLDIITKFPQFGKEKYDIRKLINKIEESQKLESLPSDLTTRKFLVNLLITKYFSDENKQNFYESIISNFIKNFLYYRGNDNTIGDSTIIQEFFDEILPIINQVKFSQRIEKICDDCGHIKWIKFGDFEKKYFLTYDNIFVFKTPKIMRHEHDYEANFKSFNVDRYPEVFCFSFSGNEDLKHEFKYNFYGNILIYKLCAIILSDNEGYNSTLILTVDGWFKITKDNVIYLGISTLKEGNYFEENEYVLDLGFYSLTVNYKKDVKIVNNKVILRQYYLPQKVKDLELEVKNEIKKDFETISERYKDPKNPGAMLSNLKSKIKYINDKTTKYEEKIKNIPDCGKYGLRFSDNYAYPELFCSSALDQPKYHEYDMPSKECFYCKNEVVYNYVFSLRNEFNRKKGFLYCSLLCFFKHLKSLKNNKGIKLCSCGQLLDRILTRHEWKQTIFMGPYKVHVKFVNHFIDNHVKVRNNIWKKQYTQHLNFLNDFPFQES